MTQEETERDGNEAAEKQPLVPGLYVVSTPIGNLRDMTLRAIDTLRSVDLVLCEDTRTFSKLAARYSIKSQRQSFHEHNEDKLCSSIAEQIAAGKCVALVTDAGTPLISDPGYPLVRESRARGLPVFTVPGPSAAIAALSISGFEPDRFLFNGFLPVKPGKKRKELELLLALDVTLILFESPHRLVATTELLHEIAPAREICVARELTKLHETTFSGLPSEILEKLKKNPPRGEIVLLIRRSSEDHLADA